MKHTGKCHGCGRTLTEADWKNGQSGIIDGRLLCEACMDDTPGMPVDEMLRRASEVARQTVVP
jgi:hypothetical protein